MFYLTICSSCITLSNCSNPRICDGAIDARSLRVAYFTLITLVFLVLGTIAFLGAITRPTAAGTILLPQYSLTSQYVFFCFASTEVVRHATQVICYRREAWE